MIDKKSYILLFCGLLGIFSFYYLRPHIDINSRGAIYESKDEVESKIYTLAERLGFDADSLAMLTIREQHHNYIHQIRDSLEQDLTLGEMNEKGIHIQSWKTIIGGTIKSYNVIANTEQLFDNVGRLKINYNNNGKLIRLFAHDEHPNPTFVQGDSLKSIAEHLAGNVFGYDLKDYDLNLNAFEGQVQVNEGQTSSGILNKESSAEALTIRWQRKADVNNGPAELILKLEPVVREITNEDGFRTEFGFSITSFVAKDEFEPVDLNQNYDTAEDELPWFNYLFFLSVLVLSVLIFATGLRSIFKGKVEWRRALMVFAVLAVGIYGWRAIFFMNTYNSFLDSSGYLGTTVNNVIFALVVGLYAALAYISWEALARDQNQKQVNVIDALWQRKIFVSETGAGLINGFGIAGITIGLISVLTFLTNDFFIQVDSQFGFAEASISPKLLTININVFTTAWLVCVAQIGFTYSLSHQWLKKPWLSGIVSIILIATFTVVLGRTLGTSGKAVEDFVYYTGIAIIFVYTIREFGMLSVFTAWWVFAVFFMIQPYLNSPSAELALVGWIQIFIMSGPLIYGFIAYRYGAPVSEVGVYIPEYEERIKQHLRVEKEIEIARESQYKLMPLQPPKGEGFDVYGFFLPSFEVGGDYFDYVLSDDSAGNQEALTMAVVDVSGKAMRAAMPAVFTSGLLLSRMKSDMPARILSQVAEPIYSRTDKRTFITCLLARYEFQTGKLSVANAGHCQPVLKRNGVAELVQTPEPRYPLGLMRDVEYVAQEITLKKGDFLLLYSDGLPEAVNEKGERFGFEEVPRLVEQLDTENLSAQEIAQEIKRTVQKFSNYQLADDTTIICLKV